MHHLPGADQTGWMCKLVSAFIVHMKQVRFSSIQAQLTFKAPITTAADDKFGDIVLSLLKKLGMIFHENRLPADNSHEISCHICYF